MLADYLVRAHFRRFNKGHGFRSPRGSHHSRLTVLDRAERLGYDIPHTVHHFHLEGGAGVDIDRHGLIRDELRLGRHDRLACRRLRHLVACALP